MKKKDKKIKEVMKKDKADREIALHNVMIEINKKINPNAIKFAKDEKTKERLPFGIEDLDKFTGGTVRGNFCIVWGGDSVGKSTLAYIQIATNQKNKIKCAYFDLEHSFDAQRAKSFGVDLEELVLIEDLKNAEQAMNILIKLAKEKVIDYAVIDSIQAMSPKGQQETKKGKIKSVEDDDIALLARKMGQFLVMSKDHVYSANVGVLLIGQVRTGGIGTFATHSTLSGGHAVKHYSLMTLFMRKGQRADAPSENYKETVTDENGKKHQVTKSRPIGFDCVMKVEKKKVNDCVCEGTEVHLPFYFDGGFFQPIKLEESKEIEEIKKEDEQTEKM